MHHVPLSKLKIISCKSCKHVNVTTVTTQVPTKSKKEKAENHLIIVRNFTTLPWRIAHIRLRCTRRYISNIRRACKSVQQRFIQRLPINDVLALQCCNPCTNMVQHGVLECRPLHQPHWWQAARHSNSWAASTLLLFSSKQHLPSTSNKAKPESDSTLLNWVA